MTDRLVINGFDIDLTAGVPVPFNFSISDVKEPNKRKRNYSKTLDVPGTANNMAVFYSAFSLSLSDVDGTSVAGFNFDPTARASAEYYSLGTLIFSGIAKINSTTSLKGNLTFSLTLLTDFTELVLSLGDLKLSELGWQEYQHTLTRAIVAASWDTSVIKNGVADTNFTAGQPDGFGYLYGLVDYGYTRPSIYTFRTNDIVPQVYAREAFIKCLEVLGITYSGNFVDSALFKTVVLGWEGGDKTAIPPIEVTNRRTRLTGDFTNAYSLSGSVGQYEQAGRTYASFSINRTLNMLDADAGWFTPTVLNDTYTQYDADSGLVVIQRTGNYRLAIAQTVNITLDPNGMTQDGGFGFLRINIKKNGAVVTTQQSKIDLQLGTGSIVYDRSGDFQLTSGDVISMDLVVTGYITYDITTSGIQPLDITLADSPDLAFDLTSINTSLGEGDTVDISRFVPDMKASDFMLDMVNWANLTISDPDLFGVVAIDTTMDFYSDTSDFDDWSDLVDEDKPIVITPSCNALAGKTYKFNWEPDTDYDNKRYRDLYGIGYGDYNFNVQSAFVTGERVYKMQFAQTIPTNELTPLVIPRIVQVDNGVKKPFKGKPRIYLYGGMKTGSWRLQNSNDSTGDNLSTYPSLHHFDDWESPTFDLNFGLVQELYYTATSITTDNSFTRFHRKFIVEVTGKDGKLVDLSVKINSFMIGTMDFGRLKMIDGILYKLNEINDFDSVTQETTEVTLLKTIDADNPASFMPNPNTPPSKKQPDIITSPSGVLGTATPYTGVIFSNSPGIVNASDETIYRST